MRPGDAGMRDVRLQGVERQRPDKAVGARRFELGLQRLDGPVGAGIDGKVEQREVEARRQGVGAAAVPVEAICRCSRPRAGRAP